MLTKQLQVVSDVAKWVMQFSQDKGRGRCSIDEAKAGQLRIRPRQGQGSGTAVIKLCKCINKIHEATVYTHTDLKS